MRCVYLEAASKSEVSAGDAFRALERIVSLTTDVLRSGSQLAFIAHTSRSTGGPWFVVISLAHPFVYTYLAPSLWDKGIYFLYRYFEVHSFTANTL